MSEICYRCGTANPLGGIYGWQDHVNDDGTVVESKTFCEPCYNALRRRIRKGLEPGAEELLN